MTLDKGDIVQNLKGKFKDRYFLIVRVDDKYAFIVDGKKIRRDNLKKKNIKHLKRVYVAGLTDFATKIEKGVVGNERIYKTIKAQTENI